MPLFYVVTEVVERGWELRNIVELIYRLSILKSNNNCGGIESILKVHQYEKKIKKSI